MISSRFVSFALLALLLVGSTSGCNCPQGANTAFVATFDADALGGPPSTAGAFGPPGATLAAQGKLAVIQPGGLSSRAVRMDRDNVATVLEGRGGGPAIASGKAYVWFKGYGEAVPLHQIAGMTVSVFSSTNETAASLKLFDGSYKVQEGSSTVNVAGSYDPTTVHHVGLTLDVDTRTFTVCVNGAALVTRPFASATASDVAWVQLALPSTITEAFPSVFVLDELRITY